MVSASSTATRTIRRRSWARISDRARRIGAGCSTTTAATSRSLRSVRHDRSILFSESPGRHRSNVGFGMAHLGHARRPCAAPDGPIPADAPTGAPVSTSVLPTRGSHGRHDVAKQGPRGVDGAYRGASCPARPVHADAFTGASLLFVVQPMVARLLLPSYGGSATVWSTSSLFFQVLLLLGYLYTHWSTQRLGKPGSHAARTGAAPAAGGAPGRPARRRRAGRLLAGLWLLRTLAVMIGLPFVVVATTGPLLQKWYSWTDGYRAEDPYFLFAASNLGSFGGLLAYPFLIEPHLTLAQQRLPGPWASASSPCSPSCAGRSRCARPRPRSS